MIDVENLYRTYGPMVLRRCRAMLKHEESARDAMHDVFVQLLRHQAVLEAQAPSSLCYRVATNVCLNRIRAAGRRPESVDDDLVLRIALAEDPSNRWLASATLGKLFRNEPVSTRVIAVMHLHDGLTLDEVAREVGLSVSGVRKRLRTLRGHLRELEAVE
jgi:RNA polymerase sigma-70 factor (ECF subfamily)